MTLVLVVAAFATGLWARPFFDDVCSEIEAAEAAERGEAAGRAAAARDALRAQRESAPEAARRWH